MDLWTMIKAGSLPHVCLLPATAMRPEVGTVFVHAPWSAPSVIALQEVVQACQRNLFVVDIDDAPAWVGDDFGVLSGKGESKSYGVEDKA